MQWLLVEIIAVGKLNYLAQIHHGNSIADMTHDTKIMSDKEVGEIEPILKLLKKVDRLGLN
jgi:hypothetical protein